MTITTRPNTSEFNDNFDRIFGTGKKQEAKIVAENSKATTVLLNRIAELESKCDDLLIAFTQDIYETGELSFSDSQWVCSFAAEWVNKAGDL